MRFGMLYELQLPKPWDSQSEQRLVDDAIEQCVLGDKLGIDYAWSVEHHFLEEYSHCSASDVFLSAIAAKTERIKIGFGIRQVIPNYNHPARTAESVGMLDLISHGRAQLGIGEGATRLELGGFNIPAKRKRAMALESAREIADMMVMEPYPGYECDDWSMPCRNVLPKPIQKPHPPMWMACTNRDTIREAARNGLGVLAFSFLDSEEAKAWSSIYYDTIKSEECVPLGHTVNANIAMVSAFSLHDDHDEASRRGEDGFRFFEYAIGALVTDDVVPGRSSLWEKYIARKQARAAGQEVHDAAYGGKRAHPDRSMARSPGIGTADEFRNHMQGFADSGVDQVIFLQQGGNNKHEHICESLERFSRDVHDDFAEGRDEREAKKAEELAPYIEAALARRETRAPLRDDEIAIVPASRPKPAA
ncbi:LLM class flavin-dependent oxidoreductase [Pseudomonadales bacterium]|jgi:alkanesulfonate monooxygenase SsuD/methylene tetrahydromethanopterin reductase-like flavin-dependent oxidoreductase (luciferase family)|nr:LLM class flavin-dependent oxidoreductase [Pseudomonadales bacterium]MDC6449214.1 LLM class flavin-dependent oxidoreductase [Pseudomonadales bacterium]